MDTNALLKALEDAEADMGGEIKKTARRHKESTMGVNTSEVEEPKLYPELETPETAGAVKELTNGQKLEIAGVSVYKWDGLVIDLNTVNKILERAAEELAESWLLTCYPAVSADSSKYFEEYTQGASQSVCLEHGAAMRIVYCTPGDMEEVNASFVLEDLLKAITRTATEFADSGKVVTSESNGGVEYLDVNKLDTCALDMLMQYAVFGNLALT